MKENFKLLQKNKKAYFNYEILETLECGIELVGSEVKSMRANKFSFQDSWVKVENGSLYLVNFAIEQYKESSVFNHKRDRERRLLAHKQEIKKLRRKVEEKGLTLVVTQIYTKGNFIKAEVAVARGRNTVNKKNVIKDRDIKRSIAREIKNSNL